MALTIALALLSTLLLILSMWFVAREWNRREAEVKELRERVRSLEAANNLRLPHRAADELLNAMAVLDLELDKKQIEFDYLANIKAHIHNALKVGTKKEK